MNKDLLQIQYRTEVVGNRTLKNKYFAEVIHTGLNDYRVFSDYERSVLQTKVNNHVAKLKENFIYFYMF